MRRRPATATAATVARPTCTGHRLPAAARAPGRCAPPPRRRESPTAASRRPAPLPSARLCRSLQGREEGRGGSGEGRWARRHTGGALAKRFSKRRLPPFHIARRTLSMLRSPMASASPSRSGTPLTAVTTGGVRPKERRAKLTRPNSPCDPSLSSTSRLMMLRGKGGWLWASRRGIVLGRSRGSG